MEGSSSNFSSQNNSADYNNEELYRLQNENDILQCQLNVERSSVKNLEGEIYRLQNENDILLCQLNDERSNVEDLEGETYRLQDKNDILQCQLNQERSSVEDLELKKKKNKEELYRLHDENDILQCQINQERSSANYLKFEMEEARKFETFKFYIYQQKAVENTAAYIKECEKKEAELVELRAYKRNMEKNLVSKSPKKTSDSDDGTGIKI